MNTFTQETLSIFYNDSVKNFIELKEKYNTQAQLIKKLEDQIEKIILEKAITHEKNENLLYKLSVMGDKITASENKVNDLNNIMMKHFAYKANPNPTPINSEPVKPNPFSTSNVPVPGNGNFTFTPQK